MKAALLKVLKNVVVSILKDGEKRNKILGFLLGLIILIIIIPVVTISLPGVLLKNAFGNEDTNVEGIDLNDFKFDSENLQNNDMYMKVRNAYLSYLEDLDYKFNDKVEDIKIKYTYTIEVEYYEEGDEHTEENKKYRTETVIPSVKKDIVLEKPELRHLLAYISTKYLYEQTASDNYKFDEKEARQYLKDITIYQETITGKDPVIYTVRTSIKDIDKIKEEYFSYEIYGEDYKDRQDIFEFSFESMDMLENDLDSSIYDYIDISELNINANGMKIPHMLQYDPQWGGKSYGSSTIAISGCGILAMTMVQAYLKNEVYSPVYIAEWANSNGYYYSGQGTAWSFMDDYPKTVGFKSSNLGKNTVKILKALEEGKPVIAIMSPGTFTKGGHFIVLRGITKEGKILVNDPNDNYHTKQFYNKEFLYGLIYSEARNFWSFEIVS